MNKIRVSLDCEGFRDKPTSKTIGKISNRIGADIMEFNPVSDDMKKFALVVGREIRFALRLSKKASEVRITSSSNR